MFLGQSFIAGICCIQLTKPDIGWTGVKLVNVVELRLGNVFEHHCGQLVWPD